MSITMRLTQEICKQCYFQTLVLHYYFSANNHKLYAEFYITISSFTIHVCIITNKLIDDLILYDCDNWVFNNDKR